MWCLWCKKKRKNCYIVSERERESAEWSSPIKNKEKKTKSGKVDIHNNIIHTISFVVFLAPLPPPPAPVIIHGKIRNQDYYPSTETPDQVMTSHFWDCYKSLGKLGYPSPYPCSMCRGLSAGELVIKTKNKLRCSQCIATQRHFCFSNRAIVQRYQTCANQACNKVYKPTPHTHTQN